VKTKVHFSASRHLRRLLMRSVSLNPRNIEIWKAFVSYCEAFGSSKLLSRVLAKALRHNSDCVGLWLSCAAYESRKNRNSEAARRLFQRALRSCHGAQDVWVAYFTFELEFASQLQQRHSLLASAGRDYAAKTPHMEEMHVREVDNLYLVQTLD
jgi:U3 small nucleolar RNA-associated protein 6